MVAMLRFFRRADAAVSPGGRSFPRMLCPTSSLFSMPTLTTRFAVFSDGPRGGRCCTGCAIQYCGIYPIQTFIPHYRKPHLLEFYCNTASWALAFFAVFFEDLKAFESIFDGAGRLWYFFYCSTAYHMKFSLLLPPQVRPFPKIVGGSRGY